MKITKKHIVLQYKNNICILIFKANCIDLSFGHTANIAQEKTTIHLVNDVTSNIEYEERLCLVFHKSKNIYSELNINDITGVNNSIVNHWLQDGDYSYLWKLFFIDSAAFSFNLGNGKTYYIDFCFKNFIYHAINCDYTVKDRMIVRVNKSKKETIMGLFYTNDVSFWASMLDNRLEIHETLKIPIKYLKRKFARQYGLKESAFGFYWCGSSVYRYYFTQKKNGEITEFNRSKLVALKEAEDTLYISMSDDMSTEMLKECAKATLMGKEFYVALLMKEDFTISSYKVDFI